MSDVTGSSDDAASIALPWIEARTLLSDRSFPRHSHDQLGVGVIVFGAHRSWSGIGQVEARTGDIIMVNPGEMHDGLLAGDAPREWRMLYFDPAVVARLAEAEGAASPEIVRPAATDSALATRLAELFATLTEEPPDLLLLEQSLVRLVMRIVHRHSLRPPPVREASPAVRAVLARIDEDPASPVNLTELAALAGVSRFQLLRGFAREVVATPHAYLVQRRVHMARRMLAGGQPIVEVAIDSGFAD